MPRTHIVRQGECLVSIARHYGFREWRTLYDDPTNEALRRQRPDPFVLLPGDQLFIPPLPPRDDKFRTDSTHRFVVRHSPAFVRVHLKNRWGEPLRGYRYRMIVGPSESVGTTDADGSFEVSIPPDAREGELVAWLATLGETAGPNFAWTVQFGGLDPIDESSGVLGRLANLGFGVASPDTGSEHELRRALLDFQARNKLRLSGFVDPETKALIRRLHGGS